MRDLIILLVVICLSLGIHLRRHTYFSFKDQTSSAAHAVAILRIVGITCLIDWRTSAPGCEKSIVANNASFIDLVNVHTVWDGEQSNTSTVICCVALNTFVALSNGTGRLAVGWQSFANSPLTQIVSFLTL